MTSHDSRVWPIFVQDRVGHQIYLTQERWEHALDHPGMHEDLLASVLGTLRQGRPEQDPYDPAKLKYTLGFASLPSPYTHIVVVVKYGWRGTSAEANNFVLTAYLVERW
jgi:hypothetical protein